METEAQGTCPRSKSSKLWSQDLNPGSLAPAPVFSHCPLYFQFGMEEGQQGGGGQHKMVRFVGFSSFYDKDS